MIGKLSKIVFKILMAASVLILAYCTLTGTEPISYEASEGGGSLSIAGNEILIDNSELVDAYNDVEKRASEMIPKKLRAALERISELLKLS